MKTNATDGNELTQDEKEQLLLWLRATPQQRLEWLDEAQRVAEKSGAFERYVRLARDEEMGSDPF